MREELLKGLAAGAAGTTALNAVTYLDMVVRGRPASTTPEETVRKVEKALHIPLSDEGPGGQTAVNRRAGLGALLGITSGLGIGAVYGLVRTRLRKEVPLPLLATAVGLGTNVATVLPMVAMGVTDPRTWPLSSWLADIVPHLAYGAVTALVFEELCPPRRRRLALVARTLPGHPLAGQH